MFTYLFKALKILLLISSTLLLTGCVEYYNQLCTDNKLRDIRGLAGIKASTVFDAGLHEAVGSKFEVVRQGRGQYRIDQIEFQTCRIAGRNIAEFKLPNGNFSAKEILTGRYGQYSEAPLVIGITDLKRLKIPYRLEARASSAAKLIPSSIRKNPRVKKFLQKLDKPEPKAKVMVILNKTQKHNKLLVENFRPIFLGFSYQ